MDSKILISRLRQLQVIDKNALAIYTDLTELVRDTDLYELFSRIADDEKRHVVLGKEMLSLLES